MTRRRARLTSMTGFGRSQGDWENQRLTVELASVNGKFSDFSFAGPPGMLGLETVARRAVSHALDRGKIRCSVRLEGSGGDGAAVTLRESTLRDYVRLYADIKERFGLEGSLTAEKLLFAPDVLAPASLPTEAPEFLEWFGGLLDKAIDGLLDMRSEEGEWLRRELERQLQSMEDCAQRIAALAPTAKETYRARLLERLRECREDLSFPEDRILAEVVLFADRTDVAEELARLGSHIQQFRAALDEGGPVGRRLDFLAQELHREINTIGSKTSDSEVVKLVVTFKEELARAREQVQNIE
ncbi:MAG: YicC family protein [Candidatus Riflebacteria bacterium]|nr:YicC family protein [Candidatus Riflebacteria bacterium]